jgi:predicted ester cyclase
MSKDDNLKLVKRALDEFINNGHTEKASKDLFTDDYVWHPGDVAPQMDREMHVIDHGELRKAFPDVHGKIDSQVADGDEVVSHFTMTGTHRGPLVDRTRGGATVMGTGRKVTWHGVTVHRIKGGKIAEGWLHYDRAAFEQQIGYSPTRIGG